MHVLEWNLVYLTIQRIHDLKFQDYTRSDYFVSGGVIMSAHILRLAVIHGQKSLPNTQCLVSFTTFHAIYVFSWLKMSWSIWKWSGGSYFFI